MKKLNLFIILFWCFSCFIIENALAEKYCGYNGPQDSLWGSYLVNMGASNILHLSSPNLDWHLNSYGAGDGLTFSQTRSAINNACDEWESVTTSTLSFSDEGSTNNTWGNDDLNVHYWAESGDPIYDEGNPFESANIAVTICTINSSQQILDTDVVYNGRDYTWRVNGSNMDIQAVATHEIGHMFGLHHTEVDDDPLPTMYEEYNIGARSIEFDDEIGVSFLYGGNLIDNETFSGADYYYWNLTVAPNKTLTISSNASITLNSKKITTSTGTINIQSGASIPPNVLRKNSSNVLKGIYPSITSAFNDAVSGDRISKGTGLQTLYSHIIVPQDVSLTFLSGSKINMSNYSITTTQGSIFTETGSNFNPKILRKNSSGYIKGLYPSIASAMNQVIAGNEIYLGTTTYQENVVMKDKCSLIGQNENTTILNGTITINSKDSTRVSNMTINNDIIIHGSTQTTLDSLKIKDIIDIENGSGHAFDEIEFINNGYVDIYQTAPDLEDITSINDVNYGIISGDADYSLKTGEFLDKTRAIYCVSNCDVTIEYPIFCNNNYDFYSANGSSISVSAIVSLSDCPPPIYGFVTLEDACIDCNPGSPKSSPDGMLHEFSLPMEGIDGTPVGLEYAAQRNLYRAIQTDIRQDRKDSVKYDISKYASRYNQVITGMKAFIAKYPETEYAQHALKFIDYSYRALEQQDTFAAYLTALGKDAKYKSLQTAIKSQFIPYYLGKGEYQTALTLTDEVMKAQRDPENALYYLYRQGVIYHKYLKDAAKAETIYKQVIDTDPNSAMAFSAGVRLGKLGKVYEGENQPSSAEPEVKFAIRNHPNPFNPVTNIQFDLPEADHVTLKVYDIQGREVITLVDALQGSGSHTIMWNSQDKFGQRVASGMYFYRIEYRGQVLTNKMILMR